MEKTDKSKNIRGALGLAAVLMISLGSAGTSSLTPIIAKIAEAFPSTPMSTIYLISTMPSLICLGSAMLIGPFVGRKIGYKTTSVIGTVCCLIGGVGPIFAISSISAILAFRALFGFGMGFMNFYNAIIIADYEGEKRAKYLGWAIVVNKIGAIAMLQIAGFLADMNWKYAFLTYSLLAVVLIMEILFMKEPEASMVTAKDEAQNEVKEKEPIKFGKSGIFWTIAWFIILLLHYPVILTLSQIVTTRNIAGGSATVASTLNSIYQIGGMVISAIFATCFKHLKKYYVPVCMFGSVVGMSLFIWAPPSFIISAIAMFIMGASFTGLGPAVTYFMGADTPKNSMPTLLSVFNIAVLSLIHI